ncbi:MAG: pyridoxamine 5'-phosphate oxidase, partial [Pseudomonadota bacterium]
VTSSDLYQEQAEVERVPEISYRRIGDSVFTGDDAGSGFTFFSNYDSAKGQDLAVHPFAAMTFFWPSLERQVRIEGRVEKVSLEESDAYFQVRPLGSRLGAWASPQSRVIADRAELEALLADTQQRFQDQLPQCPEHWGGYRLVPDRIEFWQGRSSRLHDRLNYRLQDAAWLRERLAP